MVKIVFEFWVVYGQYIIDVPIREIDPSCCFFPVEIKNCMNSASYLYTAKDVD